MSKPKNRTWILSVDSYRRPSRCRSTKGCYAVGARDAKSAVKLLQQTIGFGSIMCRGLSDEISVERGAVRKIEFDGPDRPLVLTEAKSATAPQK